MTHHRPKVFGIGFHKTATKSLANALRQLDYQVTGPFGVRDPDIGEHALAEALPRAHENDAAQDNPWPLLYKELDAEFPGSKFVLTYREPAEWIHSVVSHFGGGTTAMREWIYDGLGDPVGHEDLYLAKYNAHNHEVIAHFADRPDDLLILRITEGEGFEKLCPFLGLETPAITAFPHANPAGNRLDRRARTGGKGKGKGPGAGKGQGQRKGQGQGRGPGARKGAGQGKGRGPGAGMGKGQGPGRTQKPDTGPDDPDSTPGQPPPETPDTPAT